jgi:hypothetical protein
MAEIPEQRLHALIHDPTHHGLEGELELIDAHPMVFPEFTPESLPSASSPRLAYKVRRGMQSGGVPIVPAPSTRSGISTIAIARAQRPRPPVTAMPRAESPTLLATELPSTERPTLPEIPRLSASAIASSQAEPRPVMAPQALPPIDTDPSEPKFVAATPRSLPLNAERAHLVLPIVLVLLALGTIAFLLLR